MWYLIVDRSELDISFDAEPTEAFSVAALKSWNREVDWFTPPAPWIQWRLDPFPAFCCKKAILHKRNGRVPCFFHPFFHLFACFSRLFIMLEEWGRWSRGLRTASFQSDCGVASLGPAVGGSTGANGLWCLLLDLRRGSPNGWCRIPASKGRSPHKVNQEGVDIMRTHTYIWCNYDEYMNYIDLQLSKRYANYVLYVIKMNTWL